ncbi:autotransporter outer membrane beta-barrel domain-containing protein, partial [Variovorax sp. KK3]|uniref:autotransporter outer membrane beta-barrel domain-containing protein n=2 Tax=Variovorax sp. KK3 TaxID=1855728 RepID=UPI00097CA174
GGNGGVGGTNQWANSVAASGNGGNGGIGGPASVTVGDGSTTGSVVVNGSGASAIGVSAISLGGSGGAASLATSGGYAKGGMGGTGGDAGSATVTVRSNGSVSTQGADTPATSTSILPGVLVRSNGGAGGAGGDAGAGIGSAAGSAGTGGTGGTATARIDGTVGTTGSFAYGVLAQSVGGQGASGGDAYSVFGSYGGAATNAGKGGPAYLMGQGGTVTTTGTGAMGMVAQSIGGGGGSGGNATTIGGGGAIGGNGGGGGDGQGVTVGLLSTDGQSGTLNSTIITRGDSATALVAQSVGGAGGNGGNSVSLSVLFPSISIGGDGKSGGTGGTVNVQNDGLITTQGQQSGGIAAQSVGGGGGNGGSGVGISAGVQISTAFVLGGAGATGGTGGVVNLTNDNQVSTYGADAYGLKAQSISGGGGQGGTALATAIALGGDPELPTVSVSIALGGKGGAGGDQSNSPVTVTNNGLVTTAGDGAIGVLAQNIAGGGGNGGDSTASSYSNGGDGATNVSASASVGGSGGGGGTAGAVTVNNNALIVTRGADAYGVMAQSIAGGGGTGGTGDSSASAAAGESSYSGSITVGGGGKQGGQGGTVTVNNGLNGAPGNIATAGDGANAIFAQSVGGGGGASGGGTSKANGNTLKAGVTVGGNAGSGGNGGAVTVTNQGSLLTQGADADAVFAQSVGGGGGKAGKGTSTSGGAQKPGDLVNQMSTTIANGLNLNPQHVTQVADGVYKVGDDVWKGIGKISDLQTVLGGGSSVSALRDSDDGDGTATTLTLNATIGGQGGSGGAGSTVTVTNNGAIQTGGAKSDGIFAQSVGGGGGVGGASSFSASSTSGGDGSTNGSLTVGGSGTGGGGGNAVTVTNTAAVTTGGVTAYGISAQSIGGGGGKGGATAASSGALKDFKVTVGGSGGMGGDGGTVSVTNDGVVTTGERQAIGVLAQSIGGGGGTAHLLSSDVSVNASGDTPQVSLTLGGSGGAAGTGDTVTVNLGQNATGAVHTTGAGAIGILAQSIGGGGGLIVTTSAQADAKGGGNGGGILDGTPIPVSIGGANGSSGSANTVTVTLGASSAGASSGVTADGVGAPAVVAQSIGGGGGLFAGATPSTELAKLYPSTNQVGNGGAVNVTLQNSGWIYTGNTGSVGVLAQSIGGGGGLIGGLQNVNIASAIQNTASVQNGQGGDVTVQLQSGGNIWTAGARAHGIVAQSLGGGGGMVAGAPTTSTAPTPTGYVYAGATAYKCDATCTGNVAVSMGGGTLVRTEGDGAYGIVMQSRGNGTNNATLTLASGATVQMWNKSAGGVYVDAAGTTTVDNGGTITSVGGSIANPNAVAITNVHGTAQVENAGLIQGSIDLTSGGVHNTASGQLHAGPLLAVDQVRNEGTLEVGIPGAPGAGTLLRGNLVQGSTGRIVIDSDSLAGTADRLTVAGDATLAGQIALRPASLTRDTVRVLDVQGQLDGSQLQGSKPLLVSYAVSTAATSSSNGGAQQSIYVTPQATFSNAATGLGRNAQAVAAHLQANFDAGSQGLAPAFAQLVNGIQDAPTYRAALAGLGNESQQAVGTARLAASHAFVERMNSCPSFDAPKDFTTKERECLWGRAIDNRVDAGGTDRANYVADTQSLQFGGQRRIADGWFLGGSVAFDDSSFRGAQNTGFVSGRGTTLGVVLKHEMGPWTFSGAADFNQGSYDTTRNIAFPGYAGQARGAFTARSAGLHGRVAYTIPQDGWYLKPYLDLHAVRIRTGGYTEQGAGAFDLVVGHESDTMLSASPMLEVGGRWDLDNGMVLRPYVALGAVVHNKNAWGAGSQMIGSVAGVSPFVATSEAPTRLGKLNLGVDIDLSKSMQLRVEYGGQFGSSYRSHEGVLRMNYKF